MIWPMHLIKIDIIRLQTLQATLNGLAHLMAINRRLTPSYRRIKPTVSRTHHLRGNDQTVPVLGFQPLPKQLLSKARPFYVRRHRVNFRRIEKINARINRFIKDAETLFLITL